MPKTTDKTAKPKNTYADEIDRFQKWVNENMKIADKAQERENKERALLGESHMNNYSYERGVSETLKAFLKLSETSVGINSIRQIASAIIFGYNKFFEIRDDKVVLKIDTRLQNRKFLETYNGFIISNATDNPVFYFGEGDGDPDERSARSIFDRATRTLFAFFNEMSLLNDFLYYVSSWSEKNPSYMEHLFNGIIDTVELIAFHVESKEYDSANSSKAFTEQLSKGKYPFSKSSVGAAVLIENPYPVCWNVDPLDYTISISDKETRTYLIDAISKKIQRALARPLFDHTASNNGYIYFLSGFRGWLLNNKSLHGEEIRNIVSYLLGGLESIYNCSLPMTEKTRKILKEDDCYYSIMRYFFNSYPVEEMDALLNYRTSVKSLLQPQIVDVSALLYYSGALKNIEAFYGDAEDEYEYLDDKWQCMLAIKRAEGVLQAMSETGELLEAEIIISDTMDVAFHKRFKSLVREFEGRLRLSK